jgi:CHRD domain
MRKVLLLGVLAATGLLGVAAMAFADGGNGRNSFATGLDGWAEVPSQVTRGEGRFRARLTSDTTLEYVLTYSGLESDANAAHIHPGSHHENGGVSAFLCGGGDKPPCPPRAGEVSGVIDPTDVIGPAGQQIDPGEFQDFLRAMRAGETYANVHTSRAPGGEIRGQINDRHNHGGRGDGDNDD